MPRPASLRTELDSEERTEREGERHPDLYNDREKSDGHPVSSQHITEAPHTVATNVSPVCKQIDFSD